LLEPNWRLLDSYSYLNYCFVHLSSLSCTWFFFLLQLFLIIFPFPYFYSVLQYIQNSHSYSSSLLWLILQRCSTEIGLRYDNMIGYTKVVSVSTSCSKCSSLAVSILLSCQDHRKWTWLFLIFLFSFLFSFDLFSFFNF